MMDLAEMGNGEEKRPVVELKFERAEANTEALDAELRAAVGEGYAGVTVAAGEVRVHLAAQKAEDLAELIGQVVEMHKPEVLTPAQQKEAERQAVMAALRLKPWDDWTPADKDRLLWVVAAQLGALPDAEGG